MNSSNLLRLCLLLAGLSLLLAACGGADAPPSLPVPNEPTLVYVYTEG